MLKIRLFINLLFLSFIILIKAPNYAFGEIHLSNEFSFTYNNVSGPGSQSSSLTEGGRYLDIFGVYWNEKIKDFDFNFNFGLKMTDDPRNDIKKLSITNLQGRITNKTHTLTLGDTFESFTQYSLSTALKGGSYRYFDETLVMPEITLIYGVAAPRWDSVWRDDKTKVIERQAYGGRIKYNLFPEFWIGLSIVNSEDDKRIYNTDPLYNNTIYSIDVQYRPIPGLTITGELAFNNTELSQQEGASYVESHGYAYRLEAVGDGHPSRVTVSYERVTPDFVTLLGSATADREKFKIKWRYKWTKDVILNTGFLWYRNNLEGQRKDGRTDYYKPEVGIMIKRLFNRKYSIADISYKLSIAERNDSTEKVDHIINLNYRDRFWVFDSDTNLTYTSYDNKGTTRSRSKEYTYNTSLNSRHTVGDFILKPTVYLGGWTLRDELSDTSDIIYEYSFGLGIDIPKYNITSNFKIGENKLEKDVGDDSQKTFGSLNIFYKPKFLKLFNDAMIFLRAYINDFRYTTGTRNFRETSITTGLNFQL